MSLENPLAIDAAGIENDTGLVILTIADSWDWSDVEGHLLALQNKLNSYFEFIESRQVYDDYPAANGRPIVIDIISRFPMPPSADEFLQKAKDAAGQLDVVVRHRVFTGTAGDEE